MTKNEFIDKWCFNNNTTGMDYDLDEVIKSNVYIPPINLSSQSVVVPWSYAYGPRVDASMMNLGHFWVWPPADSFETAYCVCDFCGVTSEEKECEQSCLKEKQND